MTYFICLQKRAVKNYMKVRLLASYPSENLNICRFCLCFLVILKKFLFCSCDRRDGKALERFLQEYFDGKLKRYLKSEPIPESNDGPVKVMKPQRRFLCSVNNVLCGGICIAPTFFYFMCNIYTPTV